MNEKRDERIVYPWSDSHHYDSEGRTPLAHTPSPVTVLVDVQPRLRRRVRRRAGRWPLPDYSLPSPSALIHWCHCQWTPRLILPFRPFGINLARSLSRLTFPLPKSKSCGHKHKAWSRSRAISARSPRSPKPARPTIRPCVFGERGYIAWSGTFA